MTRGQVVAELGEVDDAGGDLDVDAELLDEQPIGPATRGHAQDDIDRPPVTHQHLADLATVGRQHAVVGVGFDPARGHGLGVAEPGQGAVELGIEVIRDAPAAEPLFGLVALLRGEATDDVLDEWPEADGELAVRQPDEEDVGEGMGGFHGVCLSPFWVWDNGKLLNFQCLVNDCEIILCSPLNNFCFPRELLLFTKVIHRCSNLALRTKLCLN